MKDTLYQQIHPNLLPFEFNEEVTQVFEDMIRRSVPNYVEGLEAMVSWCKATLSSEAVVCDLGCSTGNALLLLEERLPQLKLKLIGYDRSRPMILRANEKAQARQSSIPFYCADILETTLPMAHVFLLQYTLQFIPQEHRVPLLTEIRKKLLPSGCLMISEKISAESPRLQEWFTHQHFQLKKCNGYSDLEILQKKEALENILQPTSFEQNLAFLQQAGFSQIQPFLQWFNFASWICFP
ncbi:MAG: carboxy-S-adenosyl-L-methionine synthase CmoA [Planctomycetota bacterium]